MKLNKYELIYPNEVNIWAQKGYEFVTTFTDYYHSTSGSNSGSGSVTGTLNGAQVSLNLNLPLTQPGGLSSTTKFLMRLTPTAEALYRDKGEHEQR